MLKPLKRASRRASRRGLKKNPFRVAVNIHAVAFRLTAIPSPFGVRADNSCRVVLSRDSKAVETRSAQLDDDNKITFDETLYISCTLYRGDDSGKATAAFQVRDTTLTRLNCDLSLT